MGGSRLGTVYALRVHEDMADTIFSSLKKGEGRFGWSYVKSADLTVLKGRIKNGGWDSLSEDELDCYQDFLLEFKPEDHVVYINIPEWGKCTTARVTSPYYWTWGDKDFNHRFKVDRKSVQSFHRNDKIVHPALSRRLKLQSRWWEISTTNEFSALLEALEAGHGGQESTENDRIELLAKEILPSLTEIAERIHHTHPEKKLEEFLEAVFQKVPGVLDVQPKRGAADLGADLVLVVEQSDPILGTVQQRKYVVQVKSFKGTHADTRAVDDIRRAMKTYQADAGLIVSTASCVSDSFKQALERLRLDIDKDVGILFGAQLAAFVLRHGADLVIPSQ